MKYVIILGKYYEVLPNERKGSLGCVMFGGVRCDISFQIEGYYIVYKGRQKCITDWADSMPEKETA